MHVHTHADPPPPPPSKLPPNTPEGVVTVHHEFAEQCVIISLQGTSCIISTLDLRDHMTHSSIGFCIQFIPAG